MWLSRFFRFAGGLLVVNFLWVVVSRVWEGKAEELAWLSHVGTLAGGVGLLLRSDYLVSLALVSLFLFHGIWIVDGTAWLLTGTFPLGAVYYLAEHNWFQFLATIHHFYVLPLLLAWLFWRRRLHPQAWVGASALFAVLVLFSAFFLPTGPNVNSAHAVWPGVDRTFFGHANRLPKVIYVPALILASAFANFWLVNRLLELLVRLINHRHSGQQHPPPATSAKSR